jgi:hypothetical protein
MKDLDNALERKVKRIKFGLYRNVNRLKNCCQAVTNCITEENGELLVASSSLKRLRNCCQAVTNCIAEENGELLVTLIALKRLKNCFCQLLNIHGANCFR